MRKIDFLLVLIPIFLAMASAKKEDSMVKIFDVRTGKMKDVPKVKISEEEWKKRLGPDLCLIVRDKGTERPFTGKYHGFKKKGMYRCAACGIDLFTSEAKFDSGTGWPSFFQPVHPANIKTAVDAGHGMIRTEILCPRCGAHLGHVFDDGPAPTGKRYCINSAALTFTKKK